MIPIYKPSIKAYISSAKEALESEWISNYGRYIGLAEQALSRIIGVKYCILMSNGTAATHCIVKAMRKKYPNLTKLYVPNNVFISPWNCALQEFDRNEMEVMRMNGSTYNIDTSEEYLNSLERNSGILIVHNLGKIVNVPRIKRLRPDIVIIEDNCEGLFGSYEGIPVGGSEGVLCSSVSFYANKTITSGEGGAFLTNDRETYEYIRHYYSHGMSAVRYIHDGEGTNYRMTNVCAALIYEQLKDIDTILGRKRDIFRRYTEGLVGIYEMPKTEDDTTEANWIFSVFCEVGYDDIERWMKEKGIEIRPLFYDISKHVYLGLKGEEIGCKGIMIPSYPELTEDEQDHIIRSLRDFKFTGHQV